MTFALLTHVYVRKGKAILPVVAATDAGWLDVEPVQVIDAKDARAVKSAVLERARAGNPSGPTYLRGDHPEPVVLRAAGVKSWTTFAKGTAQVGLDLKNNKLIVRETRNLDKQDAQVAMPIAEFDADDGLELAVEALANRVAELASSGR